MKLHKKSTEPPRQVVIMDRMKIPSNIPPRIQGRNTKIPKKLVRCSESFYVNRIFENSYNSVVQLNPDFDIYYFDDASIVDFIRENFSQRVLDAYNTLIPGAYRADLFRLCYLYVNGGFYIDFNKTLKIPISELYEDDDEFVSPIAEKQIWQGFFGCIPGLPFIRLCIDEIVKTIEDRVYGENPLDVTGPTVLYRVYKNMTGVEPKVGSYVHNGIKYHFISEYKGNELFEYNGRVFLDLNRGIRRVMNSTMNLPHYYVLWENKSIYNRT